MSLIGNIDNIPVFTTIAEALAWGRQYGINGYHTHVLRGQTVYMGGTTHADILAANLNINVVTPTATQTTRTSSSVYSGGY